MIALRLPSDDARPFQLLAVGAHPDDIEIGAGGTLLQLAASFPALVARVVVLTGTAERAEEARASSRAFLPGASVTVDVHDVPDGRVPGHWGAVKDTLASVAADFAPHLILCPSLRDAHQDHRAVAEIVPTVFRDHLVLGYEVPKWDGDLSRPSVYVSLSDAVALRKVRLLKSHFRSQAGRDWFDDEVFLALARLRGMENHVRYAEAFHCSKLSLLV